MNRPIAFWLLSMMVGVVLLIMKMAHVPPVGDWSWWWVSLPYWWPLGALSIYFGFIVLVMAWAVVIAVLITLAQAITGKP